jgi:ketohexokinase
MGRILVVGNVTLDLIHGVDHYPAEDEELRAVTQRKQRGGNAANSACVLAQYGHKVSFAGTLADDGEAGFLREDLLRYGIDLTYCRQLPGSASPVSCILHNQASGSRTIVHYRDLDEYPVSTFKNIPLSEYDWFHFEGRNLEQLPTMLAHLLQVRIDQPISIEIEKPRDGIEKILAYADVLLFSRAYAAARGYEQAAQLFASLREQAAGAILICSWGSRGAYAQTPQGEFMHAPVQPVTDICDSTGAGDTFNAGLIHGLLSGQRLAAALAEANRLAARKLRQTGFDKLVKSV